METIEGEGEVVRVNEGEQPGPKGMGVVFTSLTDYSRSLIERLMIQGA